MPQTIKITKTALQQLNKITYKHHKPVKSPYEAFRAEFTDGQLIAYETGSVVYHGETAAMCISQVHTNNWISGAGSDEVGTGDYFGPVVVCACYVKPTDQQWLDPLKITDSKLINDDKIRLLAPQLMEKVTYAVLVLNNEKYNEVNKQYNMNAIKALLHNKTYLNLQIKLGFTPEFAVVDQFTPENLYFNYLKHEKQIYRQLTFRTKAESQFPAVACASIIARYHFLLAFDQLNKEYNFAFPKGAGSLVDQAIVRFNDLYPEGLSKVGKLNFKNTVKALK